jgi:hypothetical protein
MNVQSIGSTSYARAWQATLLQQKATQALSIAPSETGRAATDLARADLAAICARNTAIGLQQAAARIVATSPADEQAQVQMLVQTWNSLAG